MDANAADELTSDTDRSRDRRIALLLFPTGVMNRHARTHRANSTPRNEAMKSKPQASKNVAAPAKGKKNIASKVKTATPPEVAAAELSATDGVKPGKGKKSPAKPTPATQAAPVAPSKKEGKGQRFSA
jgi:hypothetical protein